ncbi:MAG: dihydroorotase family protein [Patescibacteria group bacterium]
MLEIRNTRLPDGTRRNIYFSDGKIYEISARHRGGYHVIDAEALDAFPGLIDPHVHGRTPGHTHKETWRCLNRAALSGGVTTVFDMPNTNPPLTTFQGINEKISSIGEHKIDSYFWFGATHGNSKEILRAKAHPRIIGVKVYMARTTGNLLVSQDQDIEAIFRVASSVDLVVGVHAEDEKLINCNDKLIFHAPTVADHCRLRDTETEVRAVTRALRIRRNTGAKLYLCHISTPEAVRLAAQEKEKGAPVYVEVCPHHIKLSAEKLTGGDGGFFKMNPPLRTFVQMDELRKMVCAEQGPVDCIGSDHAPHQWHEKLLAEYDDIPSGVPGVETLGSLLYHFVVIGQMSRKRFTDLTSANAARIFGLSKKGKLEVGADADVILCKPNGRTELQHTRMHSLCGWTPYHGMRIEGEIQIVIKNGEIVTF